MPFSHPCLPLEVPEVGDGDMQRRNGSCLFRVGSIVRWQAVMTPPACN